MGKKKVLNSTRLKHEVKPNHFEKKINRTKNVIFGKKKPKIEFGSPGYSRYQGFLKRKNLLLSQLKKRDSCNRYSDRRIGEHSDEMNEDDRLLQRLAVQRKKKYQNEDMSLYGNDIPDLIDGDKARLDSLMEFSSDDERVDATESHFGGGLLKLNRNPKSKQEIMEKVIASSKQKKYENQLGRRENFNLLTEVENEWSQLRSQMNIAAKTSPRQGQDKFDALVKELAYDTRSTSNRNQERSSDVKKLPSNNQEPVHPTHHSLDELNSKKKVIPSSKSDSLVYSQEGTLISEGLELNTNAFESVSFRNKVQNECIKMEGDELQKAKQVILDYLGKGGVSDDDEFDESDTSEIFSNDSNELSESEINMLVETAPDLPTDSPVTTELNVQTISSESIEFTSVGQASSFLDNLVSRLTGLENKSMLQELLFDTCERLVGIASSLPSIEIDPILFLNLINDSLHKISLLDSKYVLQFFLQKLVVCRESLSAYRHNEHQNGRIVMTLHLIFSLYEFDDSSGSFFIRTALSVACELFSSCTFNSVIEMAFPLFLTDSIHSLCTSSLFLPEIVTFLTKLFSFLSNSQEIPTLLNSPLNTDLFEINGETQWNVIFSHREHNSTEITSLLVYNALVLVHKYSRLYSALPCYDEIFSELIQNLVLFNAKEIKNDKFSKFIESTLNSVKNFTKNSARNSLQLLKSNPKTIKFLDPEPIAPLSKLKYKSNGSERKNMVKIFKKEFKGAVNEIRKDNAFLSRENFRSQKNNDLQRNKDVKSIQENIIEERNSKNLEKKRKKMS